ncbi:class C sortase [bacterium]|nr:class C sortase [bacterium]MDY3022654.1 class C sortase [Oliverpabstia sp.]
MKWAKKHFSTIILVAVFFIGLSLLLYPTVSDYWNSLHQSRAIASYAEEVANLDNTNYETIWQEAEAHNRDIQNKSNHWNLDDKEEKEYEALLNVGGNGIMGYIEIPSIGCALPIYHGTDDAVLQIAIGHIPGSSLPVGGESTHCVLSGHRGLPSAKLFTDLDQLKEGDLFMLRVLDETLTYEVDRILIVLPDEVEALEIEEGKDLCTLVTCTPYGVNSHRLLVRGHRVENQENASSIRVTADASQIDPVIVAPVVAVPILLVLLIWLLVSTRKRK